MSDYLGRIGQFISQGLVQQGMGAQGRFLANQGQAINNKMGEYNLKVAPDKLKLKRDEEDRLMATLYENMRQFDAELPLNQRKVAVAEEGNVLEGKRIGEMGKERAHELLTTTLDGLKREGAGLALIDSMQPDGTMDIEQLKKRARPTILEGANTDVSISNRKAYGKEAASTAGERDRALAVHLGNMKANGATDEQIAAERANFAGGLAPVKPSSVKKNMSDWIDAARGKGLSTLVAKLASGDIDEEEAQTLLPSIMRTLEGAKPQQPQAEPQADAGPQPTIYETTANLLNRGRAMLGRTPKDAAKAFMEQWGKQNAGSGFEAFLGQTDSEQINRNMLNSVAQKMIDSGYTPEETLQALAEAMQ